MKAAINSVFYLFRGGSEEAQARIEAQTRAIMGNMAQIAGGLGRSPSLPVRSPVRDRVVSEAENNRDKENKGGQGNTARGRGSSPVGGPVRVAVSPLKRIIRSLEDFSPSPVVRVERLQT